MSSVVRRSQRLVKTSIPPVTVKTNRISKKAAVKKRTKTTTTTTVSSTDTDVVKTKQVEKIEVTSDKETTTEILILSQETHLDNAIKHIKKNDPKLGAFLDTKTISDLKRRFKKKAETLNVFKALLGSIVYQQIHGKAAEAIYGRFLKLFDDVFPTPEQVLAEDIENLRSAGLSARKAEYIRDLASKFLDGTITPEKFTSMSPEEISTQLCSVKGIGQWTVDMFLMHDLHHSDILPLGDLAVRKGVAQHFGLKLSNDKNSKNKIPPELAESSEIWRPYRTLGSVLMWRIADTKTSADQNE